jgi:hypothetical protein
MQFAIRPQKLTSVDLLLARIYIMFSRITRLAEKRVILKLSSLKYFIIDTNVTNTN